MEELIVVIRNEFADAFNDVTHQLYPDHSVSIWPGLKNIILNSVIIWHGNSETDIDLDMPILTKMTGIETSAKVVNVLLKPVGDRSDPLLMSGSFSRYSLNDRNTMYEIRGLINKLLEYGNTPHQESYFGGLMHLFNGVYSSKRNFL